MDDWEEIRDVYAHFGLCMYLAQCLEQSIYIQLLFFDFFPKNIHRRTNQESWEKEIDNYEAQELSKTMGRLIAKLKEIGQPAESITTTLTSALKIRNRLAHQYFSERAVDFMDSNGRRKMISELEEMQGQLRSSADLLDAATKPIAESYGLTEEKLKVVMAEMISAKSSK